MHGLLSLPYVYEDLVAETVDRLADYADQVEDDERLWSDLVERADEIDRGVCPPWRTDLRTPAGYDGAHVALTVQQWGRVKDARLA